MSYGADILVILASLGAMAYCMVLSRRLSRLTSFDKGLGGAIAVMSSQVDEMKAALKEAKSGSDGAGNQLNDLVHQAREISSELEMMIAACHDFAEEAISVQAPVTVAPEDPPAETPELEIKPEDPQDDSVTPMFGSRRAAAEKDQGTAPTPEPLFGRRRSALG
ncbi:hypothetical protein A8B78_04960 [Jannaschia sp. EhC01]|nr:hypothetical protein A8B78_04960 [Jannaschia sp. EhC01]